MRLSVKAFAFIALTSVVLAGCPLKQEVFDVVYGEWQYSCGSPKGKGSKCTYDPECSAGLFCDPGTKVCSDAWIEDGGVCLLGGNVCADDGYCQSNPMVGRCVAMSCSANGSCVAGATISGRSCTPENQDCGANAMCILESAPGGTCVERGELGASCDGTPNACIDGLMCDMWTTNTCKNPPALGTTCMNNEMCGPNRFCLTAAKTLGDWQNPGTCQTDPKLPLGSACQGNVCGTGLHCDYSTNKCAKNRAVGESCQNGNECGEDLDIAVDCVRQVCVATTSRGAKCWPGEQDRCTGDLVCVGTN